MKYAFVAILLLISLRPAFAQTNDKYPATLKKMLAIAGSEASFKIAINQMMGMLKQQKSNVPDSVWMMFENEFSQTSMNDLVDMLLPVYQKHMTLSDLEKIIEFYETPVGRKYAEKTPFIMQESMQVGQQWGMKVGQKFQEKLKEKGY